MSEPAPLTLAQAQARAIEWILLAVSAALVGLGYLWQGIDFSAGVALGCLLIGLNFVWTRSVVRRVLRGEGSKGRVALSYLAKFGLTVLVLFLAILQFRIDPLAILVGVSSLLLAIVVALAIRSMN
jgi:hypothetical protein